MATTGEYNKIHALANARKLVLKKFGSDLLHFWPMADGSVFIRDLMRQRPLIGSGVSLQQPGMLDYGIDLQSGYLSDVVKKQGGITLMALEEKANDYYVAVPIPVGRWTGVKFLNNQNVDLTDALVVAPPSTSPSSVLASKLFSVNSTRLGGTPISPVENEQTGNAIYLYGSTTRAGQRITLNGSLRRIVFKPGQTNSPTGTAYVRVRKASNDSVLAEVSRNAAEVGGGVWSDFVLSEPLDLNNEDVRVCFEHAGDATNYFVIWSSSPSSISGMRTYYNGSWVDSSDYDCQIKLYGTPLTHSVTFPFSLDADQDAWWAYFKDKTCRDTSAGTYGIAGKYWTGTAFGDLADILAEFQGEAAINWPSRDRFTIGVLVNLDNSPANGILVALANASEAKARIKITSAKKAEGYFQNSNGTTYTVTSPAQLHPGFNLVTLSYDKEVADGVKLGVNGLVVDKATPSNFALFGETLALGVGALMKTDKTTSDQLKNAVVDDVFLAKGVVLDADLWDIYQTYITAAPLMTVESAAA